MNERVKKSQLRPNKASLGIRTVSMNGGQKRELKIGELSINTDGEGINHPKMEIFPGISYTHQD